jgi:hypothetical protein
MGITMQRTQGPEPSNYIVPVISVEDLIMKLRTAFSACDAASLV